MKIKLSWIPFIPAVLAMTVLRVISVFSNDGSATDVISKNAVMISYIAVGIALVLFVLCILFNILDKKTAPVYAVKRNAPAGVCSVLSAAFALAYSVISIINRNGNDYLLIYIICTFFAILAAIGLVFMARTHFRALHRCQIFLFYMFSRHFGRCLSLFYVLWRQLSFRFRHRICRFCSALFSLYWDFLLNLW